MFISKFFIVLFLYYKEILYLLILRIKLIKEVGFNSVFNIVKDRYLNYNDKGLGL